MGLTKVWGEVTVTSNDTITDNVTVTNNRRAK
jgi:hypothetical protein